MTTKRLLPAALVLACVATAAASIASAAVHQRPAVTGFNFSPTTFAATKSPSAAAAAAGRGTTIRFQLSAKAVRVRIAISRRLSGRKVGSPRPLPGPRRPPLAAGPGANQRTKRQRPPSPLPPPPPAPAPPAAPAPA